MCEPLIAKNHFSASFKKAGAWQLVSVAMPTKLADTSEQTYLLVLLMGLGRQLEGTTTRNCNSPLTTLQREYPSVWPTGILSKGRA